MYIYIWLSRATEFMSTQLALAEVDGKWVAACLLDHLPREGCLLCLQRPSLRPSWPFPPCVEVIRLHHKDYNHLWALV